MLRFKTLSFLTAPFTFLGAGFACERLFGQRFNEVVEPFVAHSAKEGKVRALSPERKVSSPNKESSKSTQKPSKNKQTPPNKETKKQPKGQPKSTINKEKPNQPTLPPAHSKGEKSTHSGYKVVDAKGTVYAYEVMLSAKIFNANGSFELTLGDVSFTGLKRVSQTFVTFKDDKQSDVFTPMKSLAARAGFKFQSSNFGITYHCDVGSFQLDTYGYKWDNFWLPQNISSTTYALYKTLQNASKIVPVAKRRIVDLSKEHSSAEEKSSASEQEVRPKSPPPPPSDKKKKNKKSKPADSENEEEVESSSESKKDEQKDAPNSKDEEDVAEKSQPSQNESKPKIFKTEVLTVKRPTSGFLGSGKVKLTDFAVADYVDNKLLETVYKRDKNVSYESGEITQDRHQFSFVTMTELIDIEYVIIAKKYFFSERIPAKFYTKSDGKLDISAFQYWMSDNDIRLVIYSIRVLRKNSSTLEERENARRVLEIFFGVLLPWDDKAQKFVVNVYEGKVPEALDTEWNQKLMYLVGKSKLKDRKSLVTSVLRTGFSLDSSNLTATFLDRYSGDPHFKIP